MDGFMFVNPGGQTDARTDPINSLRAQILETSSYENFPLSLSLSIYIYREREISIIYI